MKRLLKNGQLLIDGQIKTQDILIENDKIAAIGKLDGAQVNADDVFDATGLFVSPGLVDVHVHYREPGQTDKETIKTGSLAAAHGGFTTVAAMPTVIPTPATP